MQQKRTKKMRPQEVLFSHLCPRLVLIPLHHSPRRYQDESLTMTELPVIKRRH